MAMLQPYPAMKESAVPWLGEVPEHWEVRRIKTLFAEKEQRSGDGHGVLLSLTRARGIVPQAEASNRIASAEDLSKYKVCFPDDLVMNRMQAWSGMFAVSTREGLVSPDYSVFGALGASNPKYFEHLFKTPVLVEQFAQRSKGIGSGFNRLYTPDFGSVPVAVPPLPEQAVIARYLDYVDQRVRRYIQAKQKLIQLLEEQKQAIIHSAVTRGLDPDVPLKPSGVEWLGDVPEHWEVVRFKFVAMVDGSLVDPRLPEHRDKILVAPNHIERGGTARLLNSVTADTQGADSGKYNVRRGQIIYTKIRPYLRKAALAPVDCLCSADMYPISLRNPEALSAEFLLELMLSKPFTHYVVDCSLRAAIPKVNREALGEAVVWFPDLTEQLAILTAIAIRTASSNAAIDRGRREIELVREYRTRLMADVVTGKLDVREAAANLPDEPDEREPLDEVDDVMGESDAMAEDLDAIAEEAEV